MSESFRTITDSDHLVQLLELPPSAISRQDIGLLNLLCAPFLPGSETLDIQKYLDRLNRLAWFVQDRTSNHVHAFRDDPDWGHSEPMWRMSFLVTKVKLDFGAAYCPDARADLKSGAPGFYSDSRDVFIHGLLDDNPSRRWGTCSSIPVLVVAVARRLGYPVFLAATRRHLFARWDDGGGIRFNIEASNPAGMTSLPNDHYRRDEFYLNPTEERSGHFLRALSPAEEFAHFLLSRVFCLVDAARYDEIFLWAARALQFAPDNPDFAECAFAAADLALRHRYWRKYPGRKIPVAFDAGEFLRVEERSLYLTIVAHHKEWKGELESAGLNYMNACRQNYYGNNEQRDLQRFLRKFNLRVGSHNISASQPLERHPRLSLSCSPDATMRFLAHMAVEFERKGEMLKARDALHDLYMLDPCDADVFQRARAIERTPSYLIQFRKTLRLRNGQETVSKNREAGGRSLTKFNSICL